jgi:hypothetical protein
MRRPGIFERTVRDTLRVCLAGRPVPPEFMAPVQVEPRPNPPPAGANIRINFHRQGDDDASF